MSFKIGSLQLKNKVILAPMAGITDLPFRLLCTNFGAGLTFSEMLSANASVWKTDKSIYKSHTSENEEIYAVQIVGTNPNEMANAAKKYQNAGAQLIDINLGCPAKKINRRLAGAALLEHPELINEILISVVNAVSIPVSIKIRTGIHPQKKNYLEIAKIAENAGIQAITIHGRTKQCLFSGNAEYDSVKEIKATVSIPVIANGDIDSAEKAKKILHYTNADAVMIGRKAQGNPWIFREINDLLQNKKAGKSFSHDEFALTILQHVKTLHQFYGATKGLQIARKHVYFYLKKYDKSNEFRRFFNCIDNEKNQLSALEAFLNNFV